ncbi:MAG: MFS transporter, partial [Nitrososphaerota archaeon]|nr:MFS transporter [Nitrososphaerota archaeon]
MARELPRWFYFLIPFYAIQEIIYTFTPIYILHLGGNVVDVGIAVALYSIAYMPASIIGGKLADTLGKRRSLALLGLTFQAVSLVGMSLLRSIYSIEGFFTLYSFGYSITIPIVGLLVMETLPKEKWGEGNSISF